MDPVLYKAATSGSIHLFTEKKDDPSFFLQETLEKNSALHLAAKFKQKQFAEEIIALHPQLLYQANLKGDTPLHIAASVGCLEIAYLIAIHLNTESRDVEANKDLLTMQNLEGDTALHNAVRNDHFEIVKLLIEKDKELASKQNEKEELAAKIINANGDSPLFLAVDRSHFEIARHILYKVPDCSYQGRNQMNALHAAILRYHKSESFLSVMDGIPINIVIGYYRNLQYVFMLCERICHSAMEIAPILAIVGMFKSLWCCCVGMFESLLWCFRCCCCCCRRLRCRCCDCCGWCLSWTCCCWFCCTCWCGLLSTWSSWFPAAAEDFREAFIKKFPGAIKERDEFGWTPLHYAAFLGNKIAVELLLKNNDEAHTYVPHKDNEGLSAFHIAAKEGHIQVMKQLIETSPDTCELLDNIGRTALHVAVDNGIVDTVKYVLKTPSLEGLINVQDKEGNTSLHLAAILGHYEIVKKLLDDTRVDKKAMNKEGSTVIKIIISKMDLTDSQKTWIAKKLWMAGGLRSLEGILIRENREEENVEMKDRGHIESMKDRADENEREGMVVKNLSLDTKRKRAEEKELIIYNRHKEIASTHILVATIIATVTFAAGFTMPGGYKSDQGMAVLSRKTAFQSFLISDTIAFCFSATSMFFHFYSSVQTNRRTFIYLIHWAGVLTYFSLFAMVIAFISGTNVVLAGSSGLAIANIAVGCCFFLFFYLTAFIL